MNSFKKFLLTESKSTYLQMVDMVRKNKKSVELELPNSMDIAPIKLDDAKEIVSKIDKMSPGQKAKTIASMDKSYSGFMSVLNDLLEETQLEELFSFWKSTNPSGLFLKVDTSTVDNMTTFTVFKNGQELIKKTVGVKDYDRTLQDLFRQFKHIKTKYWRNGKLISEEVELIESFGLSKKMIETLDKMYPQGYKLTHWTDPNGKIESSDKALGSSLVGSLGINAFHQVVNGHHMAISKNGKFHGYYQWGGKSYPKPGEYYPWSRLVKNPKDSGFKENGPEGEDMKGNLPKGKKK